MKRKRILKKRHKKSFDWGLLSLAVGLTLFGILMVFDASVVEAYQQFGDKFHFVKLQTTWAVLGMVAMLFLVFLPLKILKSLSGIIFLMTIGLLILVLIPGIGLEAQGAKRWINLGIGVLQPSEIAKLGITIYFASWLSKHQRLLPFAFITGLTLSLIVVEPDLGTAVIIGVIAFVMYFLSGAPLRNILAIGGVGLVIGALLILVSPYRLNRLKTFLDPSSDPLGASYHVRQVLIALGSGNIWGQGFGRSRQKYQYLPEATTDSIFAVIAEETGFVGGLGVIGALMIFLHRGFVITSKVDDGFSKLLAGGITTWFSVQALINLSAMVALVPLTGVPLPFISYGGSSLITTMMGTGVLLNLSREKS